jgi:hypothetical protein
MRVCTLLLEAANPDIYGLYSQSLQSFNVVFSYLAFYSVIVVGGLYSLRTW